VYVTHIVDLLTLLNPFIWSTCNADEWTLMKFGIWCSY